MADKLWFLIPEIWLFVGVVIVSILGLSRRKMFRDILPLVVCVFLVGGLIITPFLYSEERVAAAGLLMPMLGKYVKMLVCAIGIILTMLSVGLIDRDLEASMSAGRTRFDPIRVNRGEYY